MSIELRNQLLYIIANEDLGFEEYILPSSSYHNSHSETYWEFICQNQAINIGLNPDKNIPEQLWKAGMVVYQGFGPINECNQQYFHGFDYEAGLLLPKNFKTEQKKKLIEQMEELKQMYIEFVYYENNHIKHIYNKRNEEYTSYQKLKKIVYSR